MIQNGTIDSLRRIPPFIPQTHNISINEKDFVYFIGGTDDEEIYLIYLMQKSWKFSVSICSPDSFLAFPDYNFLSLSLVLYSDSQEGCLFLPLSSTFSDKFKIFNVMQNNSFGPSSWTSPVHTEDNVLIKQESLSQRGGFAPWVPWVFFQLLRHNPKQFRNIFLWNKCTFQDAFWVIPSYCIWCS